MAPIMKDIETGYVTGTADKNYNIIWTECGTAEAFYRMLGEKVPKIDSNVSITPQAMLLVPSWGR